MDHERKGRRTREYKVLPPDETPVWRYVNLPKLLSLLHSRALFMCRADLLDDAFEGSFTVGSLQDHEEEWGTSFPDDLVVMSRWVPSRSYVNCWHVSEVESAALWRMYAGADGSIALRSSVGALKAVFPERADVTDDLIVTQDIRRVLYIDYRSRHPHVNDLAGPLCYKRKAFAFEQELRLIRQELPTGPSSDRPNGRAIQLASPPGDVGREVPVDLKRLVEGLHLAPSSPKWMLATLQEVVERFGVQGIECRQSYLDELPEIGRL